MHPLSLGARPGREDRVLHVTKGGLDEVRVESVRGAPDSLFLVRKLTWQWLVVGEVAEQRVEATETMLASADVSLILC